MPAYDAGVSLRALPPEAVDALLAAAGPDVQVPLAAVELRLLGGAVARPAAVPNAVSGRDGAFVLHVVGPMVPELETVVPAVTRSVLEAVEPFTMETGLANFEGEAADPHEEFGAWPLADRDRLELIRKKYGATEVFTTRR